MSKGLICVSICASTLDEVLEKCTAAATHADVVEIRFDCLGRDVWSAVPGALEAAGYTIPVLATLRSQEQGGRLHTTPEERLRFVKEAAGRYWACDIEDHKFTSDASVMIASDHDFGGDPRDPSQVLERLRSISDTVKIAVNAEEATDAIDVWKLLEAGPRTKTQIIPIAMGDGGKWVRVLGLAHGAFLTFAALDLASATAPGQISAQDMTELYRVKQLTPESKVFGVVGDPVSQSLSTHMHNRAFTTAREDAVFIPFLVRSIDSFMRRMVRRETREVELNLHGFSVTMPHKRAIMPHLDAIDPIASRIGAVNTVEIDGDKLIGHNTDAHGFITPLRERFGDIQGSRVAVCGAGGAARACVYALQENGANVEVFVRDVARASEFGEEFGVEVAALDDLRADLASGRAAFDILVDTTPVGMAGALEGQSLLSPDDLKGVRFVYDLVTKASDTPIIREATAAGIPAIGGIEMLVAQGAKQFEIWTKKKAPVQLLKKAIMDRFAASK